MDETLQLLGETTFNKCMDLRTELKKKNLDTTAAIISPPASQPQRMSMSHDYQNIPKAMSPLCIPPWKSSTIPTTLPPAPKILDPTLEIAAFTHIGKTSGKVNDLCYERLEWVGDAYIELVSTLLISQTFPSLDPGKCSRIRERLVKNVTLADFSYKYGFDKRAILPQHFHEETHIEKTKVFGDIFEAYVAAVILSDPENGTMRVAEWLKEIWGMMLAKDIIAEERSGYKIDSPLWRLRGDVEVQSIISSEKAPLNPKEQLRKMIGTAGVQITYKDSAPEKKSPENNMPIFFVGVYLDGWGEKNKLLGSGKGMSKKEAGFMAANIAMQNKKLMKVYMEKKKIADTQLELEKQALAQQGT